VDDGRGRTFPCEKCGADVEFDIGTQSLKCPFCAHVTEIRKDPARSVSEQDYAAQLKRLAQHRRDEKPLTGVEGIHEVRCDGCGANVAFQGTLTSTECAFCGMPIQREKVHDASDRVPVDGVLPFQFPQAKAKESLAQWVRTRWFAPTEFKTRGAEGKFSGLYVPYWTFDALTSNRYTGERGEAYYVPVRTGKTTTMQRRIRWYPASGSFRLPFDDVLVVAAKGLPLDLIRKLEPWPLARCKPFGPEFLAGYLAQTYDVPLDAGFLEARERMDEAIAAETRRQIGGDEQRVHSIRSDYDAITYKHLLLPVWLLSYRYKETTYRVVVNAVTGEVQGTRPWSAWKIAFFVLACLAVLGGVIAIANS
jgi:predicted RNA-binding Zn-ribbon protein involved in translation (DUF1610 family)